jgi:hypothetical protein
MCVLLLPPFWLPLGRLALSALEFPLEGLQSFPRLAFRDGVVLPTSRQAARDLARDRVARKFRHRFVVPQYGNDRLSGANPKRNDQALVSEFFGPAHGAFLNRLIP